ncbi:MAG: serine protease [Planctomycetota bacterium]
MPSDRAPLHRPVIHHPPALLGTAAGAVANAPGVGSIRWPDLDLEPLIAEDLARTAQPGTPTRIGVNRAVPHGSLSPSNGGLWGDLPDGGRVWSARLTLPGAQGVRVHFLEFDLAPGTRVVIAGEGGAGPSEYVESGVRSRGEFWAAPTEGEVVIIELQDPTGSSGHSRLVIDEVSHLYRGLKDSGGALPNDAASATLLSCHEDVSCHPVDPAARDAVGVMFFPVPGGTGTCTGTLLNDADPNTFAGYLLTANHCISDQASADGLSVYWFYQTDSCNGTVPSLPSRPHSNGATLLATSSGDFGGNDSSFLRLDNDPSAGQGFAAWTNSVPAVGATVRGIHHPGSSHKRFSEGLATTEAPICSGLPLPRYVYNDWTIGITEGGSSGSALFNETWEVVGQLYGVCYFASPTCTNPEMYNNVYGRFSYTYDLVSAYLEAVIPDDGYEDNDAFETAAPMARGSHSLRLVDFNDYFTLTFGSDATFTATATFNPADMNLNLQLLTSTGDIVDTSNSSSGIEVVGGALAAGTYVLRASKDGGWGGDYTLDIDYTLSQCPPPDAPIDEPAPAPKNRYISFTPGNAGRSTAIRVTLASLHHPDPPYVPGVPTSDFSEFEGTAMWVGLAEEFPERDLPPQTFFAATLQCEPYYADWSSINVLQVYGSEILPSSLYLVDAIEEACDVANPANFSPALAVVTARWGDVAFPWQQPSPALLTEPNVRDVTAAVDRIKQLIGSIPKYAGQLQPHVVNPVANMNVLDLASVVDAVKSSGYPFPGPFGCP